MTKVTDAATRHGIPPNLIKAIIEVESGGDEWAFRYEPHYRWLWDVQADEPHKGDPRNLPSFPGVSQPTERIGQKTSWGLMQVMGATARELGFRGRFLSELCRPEKSLEYGCKYLARLYRRFGDEHGWEGVVAAFNAGSPRKHADGRWRNQQYVDRVKEQGGL